MAEKYTLTQGAAQWLVEKIKSADDGVKELKNHTRVNLLRPTLGTTTLNGVTCTNNGDGTYTLNGTATDVTSFVIGNFEFKQGVQYKLVGCPSGGNKNYYIWYNRSPYYADYGDGKVIDGDGAEVSIVISVESGVTVNNLLFKPMITDDLSATYDDFVSYEDSFAINRNAAQKLDVLTYEEIQASTDLSGKIASASAVKDVLPIYNLVDSRFDFHNIPYSRCYGVWHGSQGVKNAPNGEDGNYVKIGVIIIAISGWDSNRRYTKALWSGWDNWISF